MVVLPSRVSVRSTRNGPFPRCADKSAAATSLSTSSFQYPVAMAYLTSLSCDAAARPSLDLDIFSLRLDDRTRRDTGKNIVGRADTRLQIGRGIHPCNAVRIPQVPDGSSTAGLHAEKHASDQENVSALIG